MMLSIITGKKMNIYKVCFNVLWIIVILGNFFQCQSESSGSLNSKSDSEQLLRSVDGKYCSMADYSNHLTIISFIDLTDEPGSQEMIRTRSQMTSLKSIHRQYHPQGLKMLIVESTSYFGGTPSNEVDQINFSYDWSPADVPLVHDTEDYLLANTFAITTLPTTVLLNTRGEVIERWEGLAQVPQIASELDGILSHPQF